MEHRWGMRQAAVLDIGVCKAGCIPQSGRIVDVSLSGACIRTAAMLPVMSQIEVEVGERRSAKSVASALRIRGRVVRHAPMSVGVEWDEFASEALRDIIRLATAGCTIRSSRKPRSALEAEPWRFLPQGSGNNSAPYVQS